VDSAHAVVIAAETVDVDVDDEALAVVEQSQMRRNGNQSPSLAVL